MLTDSVLNILAFVPAKDFELATQFYKEIGFTCPSEDEDVRTFKLGGFSFLLQDYYVADWANNFMMNLHVNDIDGWHAHLAALDLPNKYPGTRLSAPELEDWGMIVMHLVDPTGVLWHITQWPRKDD